MSPSYRRVFYGVKYAILGGVKVLKKSLTNSPRGFRFTGIAWCFRATCLCLFFSGRTAMAGRINKLGDLREGRKLHTPELLEVRAGRGLGRHDTRGRMVQV